MRTWVNGIRKNTVASYGYADIAFASENVVGDRA